MKKIFMIKDQTIKIDQGIKRTGKDDMNLVELPFTLLTKRNPKNLKTIERKWISKGEDGKEREFYKIITGSDKWGLPTFIGEEVFLACMELSYKNEFKSRKVHTSKHELIKLMGWPNNGKSYKRLITAFNQLLGLSIITNAFWDNQEKKYIQLGFGIIDDYAFFEDKKKTKSKYNQMSLPLGNFNWNEKFFENSIQKGYVKTLDTKKYFSLESYISKRLYRYADKKLYKQGGFEIDLFKLAFDKLEMIGNYKYPSAIIQKLTKPSRTAKEKKEGNEKKSPIEELKENGINIIIKESQTDSGYKVCFNRCSKNLTSNVEKPTESPSQGETDASKLVTYFHNQLNPKDNKHQPNNKELEQAQMILNKYGQQKSQYIIDFAVEEADKTHFDMQYFGAILNKCDQAMGQYEQAKERKAKVANQDKENRSKKEYEQYKEKEIDKYINQLPPEQYQKELKELGNKLSKENFNNPVFNNPSSMMYQLTVKGYFSEELIKQKKVKILTFEDWTKQG